MLPFDSHNHVHMGSSDPVQALYRDASKTALAIMGMAVMSTHPRDYGTVRDLSEEITRTRNGVKVVPCFGVHPWFLHELSETDRKPSTEDMSVPQWVCELQSVLMQHPNAGLGECGLDGFHFDPTSKELTTPIDVQAEALRLQLNLAARLRRPVSIHCVQSYGRLMDILSKQKKSKTKLPPKIYFHAFGGKVGTVDQLVAICDQCYFGFAPVVNFRAPKTADVLRRVGIRRLLLETDHENASLVSTSIDYGVQFIAETLEMTEEDVVHHTTINALNFYNLN